MSSIWTYLKQLPANTIGTIQGNPVAMPMYALGSVPLIHAISRLDIVQAAFADDLTAGGKLKRLHNYWTRLIKLGPKTGYCKIPNISPGLIEVR